MKDYKHMSCVVCGDRFDESSDIVVCPVCGAPHHRECWKEEGHCFFEDRHADGYEWVPDRVVIGGSDYESSDEKSADGEFGSKSANDDGMMVCPVCFEKTSKNSDYCEKCGYYIAQFRNSRFADVVEDTQDFQLINGVPAGDIKRFVGPMWVYYVPRFLKMVKKKSGISFNFTAFITQGLWFFSRKMYAMGAVLIAFMLGVSAYQAFFYDVFNSALGSLVDEMTMLDLLNYDNMLFWGLMLYYFMSFLQCVVVVCCGLFGNKMYMNFCVKRVKKINRQATKFHLNKDQFNDALKHKGGVATLPAVSAGACYFIILYAIMLI